MPVHYEMVAPKRFVRIFLSGVVTESEVYEATSRIRHEPTFNPDMRCLIDLLQLDHAEVSPEFLSVMGRLSILSGRARRAILVPSAAFERRVRPYLARLNPETARVFHQVADALAFLNEGVGEAQRIG